MPVLELELELELDEWETGSSVWQGDQLSVL